MAEQSSKDRDERVGFAAFVGEMMSELVNLDRGVPGTYWDLFARPGQVVSDYFGPSDNYMNPFRYVIFVTTVVTLILSLAIDFEAYYMRIIEASAGDVSYQQLLESLPAEMRTFYETLMNTGWLMTSQYLGVAYILLSAPCLALVSFALFRGAKPYFSQHFVFSLYFYAQLGSLNLLFAPMQMQMENMVNSGYITIPAAILYLAWMSRDYLSLEGAGDYIKVVLVYLLALIPNLILTLLAMVIVTAIRLYVF